MSATSFKKEHAGVTYIGARDDTNKVVGSITKGGVKWTLAGFPKINRTIGSYKHGDEVQITIWAKIGSTTEKPRVQFEPDGAPKVHKWDTVEIFFTEEVWNELLRVYGEVEDENS